MAALDPNSFEFQLFFVMTLIILAVKAILIVWLTIKVLEKRKDDTAIGLSFIFGMWVLLVSLFVSRIFFTYFDFVDTRFDSSLYPKYPLFWRLGMFISSIGVGYILFVLDKKVLNFKLKGILTYINIAAGIFILVYPINNSADFSFVSGVSIVANGGLIILLILFIYIAIKTPGLRKNALMVVIGGLLYAIGVLLVNEAILAQLRAIFGEEIHVVVFFFFMAFKISGLIIMSYGFTKFSM